MDDRQPNAGAGSSQPWTVRADDRPYAPPQRRSNPLAWIAGIAVVAAIAMGFYIYVIGERRPPPQVTVAPPAAPAAPAPAEAKPAVQHPIEPPPPEPLPALGESDPLMGKAVAGLVGTGPFGDIVIPEQLVRRIVATVDNLPRRAAPRRVAPFHPVPGSFVIAGKEPEWRIDPKNEARYANYLRVFEAVNPQTLAALYVRTYPLFQRAYEELGFPGRYFNDRLIEMIDDLLAAPVPVAPVALARPKVLFEFADPALEARSAGQKIMIRIGAANAARVKARLRAIRAAVLAAGKSRP